MCRLLLIIGSFFLCSTALFSTGDSLNYLTAKDTIFLKITEAKEKFFTHHIEQKQTLFSLAKFYGMTLDELEYYNPGITKRVLALKEGIVVPIPNKAIYRYRNASFNPNDYVPIFYVIRKGDTAYKIAKTIFKMPVDTLMDRNNMSDFTLALGQKIHVGWMSIKGIPQDQRAFQLSAAGRVNQHLKTKYKQAKGVKREYSQQGVAFWQKDGNRSNDFVALHRSAPLNSIIAVTNPMTKRTLYARVVGKIPSTVYGKNVIVVISSKAAKELGAKDPRFFVMVKYLK